MEAFYKQRKFWLRHQISLSVVLSGSILCTEVSGLPETPVMVTKGQVAHWSGFQEEVGSVMAGTETAGLTMVTGSTGTGREMSPPPLRADTED